MRANILTGVGAAAALTLTALTPAYAAPETTVTKSDVEADTAIEIPYDYDVWGDTSNLTDAGTVEYPFTANQYDGDAIHNSFAMSARAPEGCVRTVESFTFGYTLAEYADVRADSIELSGGIGTDTPIELITVPTNDVDHSGAGEFIDPVHGFSTDRVWLSLTTEGDRLSQSGSLTLTFPEPLTPEEARGYIGFGQPNDASWVVNTASFQVTDTCTGESDGPAVTPISPVKPASVQTGVTLKHS